LEKLKFLLTENMYKGPENELNSDMDQTEDHLTNRRNLVCYLFYNNYFPSKSQTGYIFLNSHKLWSMYY